MSSSTVAATPTAAPATTIPFDDSPDSSEASTPTTTTKPVATGGAAGTPATNGGGGTAASVSTLLDDLDVPGFPPNPQKAGTPAPTAGGAATTTNGGTTDHDRPAAPAAATSTTTTTTNTAGNTGPGGLTIVVPPAVLSNTGTPDKGVSTSSLPSVSPSAGGAIPAAIPRLMSPVSFREGSPGGGAGSPRRWNRGGNNNNNAGSGGLVGSGDLSASLSSKLVIPPSMDGIELADLDLNNATVKGQGSFAKVVQVTWTISARWVAIQNSLLRAAAAAAAAGGQSTPSSAGVGGGSLQTPPTSVLSPPLFSSTPPTTSSASQQQLQPPAALGSAGSRQTSTVLEPSSALLSPGAAGGSRPPPGRNSSFLDDDTTTVASGSYIGGGETPMSRQGSSVSPQSFHVDPSTGAASPPIAIRPSGLSTAMGVSLSSAGNTATGSAGSGTVKPPPPPPPPGTKRQVAVKIMNKEAVNRSVYTSLQTEVDICSTLSHPCIINTLGVIEDATSIYIIMDLAEGGELFGYTRRFGLEDMPQVAPNFLAEVILGLEYMQDQGCVHRDIKPENLLLTSEYHVKIADFGTACKVDSVSNTFTGTPAYVSPEVVTGGRASETSDVWALGCVLYQLFVGRPPFQGESAYFIMEAIKKRKFEFPPYFPGDARDLVEKMLTVDPTQRIGARRKKPSAATDGSTAGGATASPPGSAAPAGPDGFEAIKRHPFFRNVNWATCLDLPNVTFLNETHSNARWAQYLLKDETVIFASKILKERYAAMSVKERYLILTDYPRLFYVKEENNAVKGQVPWTDSMCAQADNSQLFHVYTGTGIFDRVFHFVDAENHAPIWAAKINDQVKQHKAKQNAEKAKKQKQEVRSAIKAIGGRKAAEEDWVDVPVPK